MLLGGLIFTISRLKIHEHFINILLNHVCVGGTIRVAINMIINFIIIWRAHKIQNKYRNINLKFIKRQTSLFFLFLCDTRTSIFTTKLYYHLGFAFVYFMYLFITFTIPLRGPLLLYYFHVWFYYAPNIWKLYFIKSSIFITQKKIILKMIVLFSIACAAIQVCVYYI